MQWIAPSEKDAANDALEKRLWDAADQFRANSGLTAQQYSGPILGLIFLRFAEARFALRREALEKAGTSSRRGSRLDDPAAYHAEGVLYLTPSSRYDHLLALPEGADVGKIINDAMAAIEKHNPQLAGVLPRTYQLFSSSLLKELLKTLSEIPVSLDYDAFGRIYEYFLGQFARTEGQKGGEFYTPSCIVRLIVEILEPFHGRVLDPACGSGGMFVQSARFVAEHKRQAAAGKLPSTSGRGAGVRVNRIVRTRSCLSMLATSSGRSTGPTANGRRRRLASSPMSFASIEARNPTSHWAAKKRRAKSLKCSPPNPHPSPLPKGEGARRRLSLLPLGEGPGKRVTARPRIATLQAYAKRPRSTKSKHKVGRSIPAVMSASRRVKKSATRISRNNSKR
jgi:hypothetical protein